MTISTQSMATPRPGALEEGGAAEEVPGDTGMSMSVSDLRLMEADAATLREARAEAQLMLAGPDLFAALEDICQTWMEENPGTMVAPIYRGLQALKKARSGQ
jgi:hypothetical protein